MATTTDYVPPSGFSSGSFKVEPNEGYYIAGITVIDGLVVDASVKSTQFLYTASAAVPSGVSVPSGLFASSATHYVTYN